MAIRTLVTKLLQTSNLNSFLIPNSSPPVIQSGVSPRRASVPRNRSMRCEPLERRELLAAEVLPEIRSFADFPAFLNGNSNAALTQRESSAFTHTISPNDFSGFWEASDPTELISVEIRVDDAFSTQDAQAALAELDFEETASFGWNLEGYLARGKMVEAAELPMVQVVRENSAAIFNAGTVSSQADPAMRSNLARSQFNVNGAGIKIGVISDSYSRTNGGGGAGGSIASGNLPGPGNPNGFTIPVTVLQDAPTTGPTAGNGKDEGRAMLELIHDIAPGAQLFFHTAITGPVQFAEAVQALSAAGVDIIVDDVTYAGMQIFQDGVTAQAVAQATSAGISFFSSAGNQGSEAYSALYQTDGRTSTIPNFPPTAGKVYEPHDFDPGPGVDNFQRVVLGSGRSTTITFQWDQPSASLGGPGASTDMDIIVFNEFGTPVSGGVQNNVGQDPIEIFPLSNPTNSPLILEVGIFRNVSAGGPRPNIVHYHPLTSPTDFDIFQFETFGGTLFGHHQAPGVAAIAAVDYRQTPAFGVSPPGVQESTSEGGLPILFDTAGNRLATPEIRTQPVVTAPDTINNSFFGSPLDVEGDGIFNFAGTSAAAPNAAAVAALMLQAAGGRGSLTPAQIRAAMANTAIDIPLTGNGFDHFTGFGLIDANAAVAAVRNTNPPPPPPPPPPPNPPSPSLIDREIGESGTFRVDQDWKTIQLQNAYVDPVVIASPASFGGPDPVTVRVRNVTSNSFQVRLQEWDYDDGNHSLETVSYLVVEKGSYALPDGRVLHAGTTSVNQNLKRVDFPDIFETSPVVLSQSQTDNGPAAIVTRQQDIGRVGFSVRLQEEEGADNSHSNERVGYVAIEAGTGNAAGTAYRVGRTGERISEAFASINLGTGFDAPPAFLAAMQTTTGADPAGLRFRNLDKNSVQVFVEEEQSADAETSHSDENVGFAAFEIGSLVGQPVEVVGESGTFRVDQDWKTIQLQNVYVDPVVIASPASFDGSDPVTVRVRNVTSNSFQVRLQEWDYDDGNHSLETVSYLVVEKGSYALPDGRVLHAGTTSVNQNLKRVDFPDIFETSPVVLSQSQTVNGPAAIVTRQQEISRTGFRVRVQEEQGADGNHSNERVGYVAIEAGTGNAAGTAYRVGRTGERISEAFASINLGTGFDAPPAFLAAMQTTTGADPAGLRFRNLDRDSVQVFVEEEQSADAETNHSDENVGFAAFEIGAIVGQPVEVLGESGKTRVDQDWKTIQLQNVYVDPVVIASPASFDGSDPVTVRVRNVTSNSFQVRLQEWDYDDGNHSLETVSYLVVEKGSYALPDGRVLHAGTTSVNQNLKRVDFPDIFETSPVVLSQSQTDNGPAAIVTRQQEISRTGFRVRVQEEQGADGNHSNERLGYVAIEAGTGNAAGTAYRVGRTGERISEAFASINLGTGFDAPPAFLAAMQTTTGADPAGLRFRNLDKNSVQVFVEEEQSADAETSHSDENVGFAAFEIGAILARAATSNASLNQAVAMTSSNAATYDNNDGIAMDSNRDGSISALDALVIINFLSNYSSSEPADVSLSNVVESFDANGDGFVTARDALVVINYLTKQSDIGSKTDENKTVPRWDADEVFASDEDFLLEHNLGISTDLF